MEKLVPYVTVVGLPIITLCNIDEGWLAYRELEMIFVPKPYTWSRCFFSTFLYPSTSNVWSVQITNQGVRLIHHNWEVPDMNKQIICQLPCASGFARQVRDAPTVLSMRVIISPIGGANTHRFPNSLPFPSVYIINAKLACWPREIKHGGVKTLYNFVAPP